MSPELQAEYEESCKPFIDGAITPEATKLHNWRVFLEVNSLCNLRCPTCTKGNQAPVDGLKYEHQTGIMEESLMERILDKIALENPKTLVYLYGNSEPFLHPKIAECVASVRRRGLSPQLSTNLNYIHSPERVTNVLNAMPDLMIISLSGFTQDVYVRGHVGGDIEKVKANMRIVAEINNQRPPQYKIPILVNYHLYDYNHHEVAPMEEYAKNLGLGFFTSIARAISMENAIQYCRSKDPDATPYEVQEGRPDWNQVLPPVGDTYKNIMARLRIPPDKAREMYAHHPMSRVCPVGAGSLFTFIRHDGLVQLCACTADRRITLGNYLDMTPDQMIEKRTDHSICKQCIKYRTNLYFMIADRDKWVPPV